MNNENFQKYSGLPKKIDIEGEKTRWHKFLEFINPFFKLKYKQGEELLSAKLRQELGKADQEEGKGRQEKIKAIEMELKLNEILKQKEFKEVALLKAINNEDSTNINKELDELISGIEYLKITKAVEVIANIESLADKSLKEQIIKSLNTKVEELDLNVRTYNALKELGYNTLRDIVIKREIEILEIDNITVSDLSDLVTEVNKYGLRFGLDVSDY